MEIFKTFGLDPIIAIAQVVNFLVILYILKRFLYKPLFAILNKRKELAKEAVKNSEETNKVLEKAKDEESAIIKKAQTTAHQIINEAKEQSEIMLKQAEEATKKQTEKMLKDAKTQIELETTQAQAKLNKHILELSIVLLKKSLGNVFSEKEQSEIIEKALKEMQQRPN